MGRYPYGALQRASFMWRPRREEKDEEQADHTLWLWLHPRWRSSRSKSAYKRFQLNHKHKSCL
ncbi:GM12421 [Drosophila sechellia]|uniref:GM12421 n=1 Tax=Drosophila sechellia TaxID=7238 RepID=B4I0M8_DROSE|nr:GM12421 [Drosophila sechellia]